MNTPFSRVQEDGEVPGTALRDCRTGQSGATKMTRTSICSTHNPVGESVGESCGHTRTENTSQGAIDR